MNNRFFKMADGEEIPPAQGNEFDDDIEEQMLNPSRRRRVDYDIGAAGGNTYSPIQYNLPQSYYRSAAVSVTAQPSLETVTSVSAEMKRAESRQEFAAAASSASYTEEDEMEDSTSTRSSTVTGKRKRIGRPKGKPMAPAPAKTVAASTNAEKRQKIRNLFRKVATVDLVTDIENASHDDPITKFVLVQVSTAPPPPVEGGGPHRKVVAEKKKTVTIYGGPTDMDLRTTLAHASAALSGQHPEDYKTVTVHNIQEVDEHFKRIEQERRSQKASST